MVKPKKWEEDESIYCSEKFEEEKEKDIHKIVHIYVNNLVTKLENNTFYYC